MKISASIYSNTEKDLPALIQELDAHHIDLFHVDCNDEPQVFEDLKTIRSNSSTPIDLHLITSTPEQYFPLIEELKIEYVCLQYESLNTLPDLPKNTVTKFGLAITSATPLSVFETIQSEYSFLLIMTTTPGKSGGTFHKENCQRIIAAKYQFPNVSIHVDGGVNAEIAFILRLIGVNTIVSGSYLMNQESLGAGILSLSKHPKNETDTLFEAKDFMVPLSYLPVLNQTDLSFRQVLKTIDDYRLGFALLTDSDNHLSGVISNADIRKGLLKTQDWNQLSVADLVNTKPISIPETASLYSLIKLINNLPFLVLFLPVVNQAGVLKGAILLNNLARG